MKKIRVYIKEHQVAIILALVASIITAFPQVYFRIDDRVESAYQGIELIPDSPWFARVREVQDGYTNFGAMYTKEGKGDPYLLQPLGSIVVGHLGKVFHLDINNTILLSKIVLSFFVFLLLYHFVHLISKQKLAALVASSAFLLADSIMTPFGITQVLHGLSPDNFLQISRPVNPLMVYILFFGFLVSFLQFYRRGGWEYGILSAVLLGFNFYNYFYAWSFLFAFGGLLGLFLLSKRKWKHALKVFLVYFGGCLVAIPYIINLFRAAQYPAYEEVASRIGIIYTHEPVFFIGVVPIAALLLFLWKFAREDIGNYLFGLALLLAPVVTQNQQLITGRVMQPDHYHQFMHKPIAVVFIATILFCLFDRYKIGYKRTIATFLILVSFSIGIFTQIHSYNHDEGDGLEKALTRQKYGPALDWLNTNAKKRSVVFANDEMSHMTVIYTPFDVFHHRSALFTTLSITDERLQESFFTFYRLRGIGAEHAEAVFFDERKVVSGELYGIYYKKLFGSYEAVPDEKIRQAVSAYQGTMSESTEDWLVRVWSKYDVSYVVWDKDANPDWELDQYPFLTLVGEFGTIRMYSFIPESPSP